ncbi:hypothetical protein BDQ17DRAFT_1431259 [Cyathus striatus]|nr:hypothetical protein BDQ17DRAFT_1431259 [Cyathus striatus]
MSKQVNVTPAARNEPELPRIVKPMCVKESKSIHQEPPPSITRSATPLPVEEDPLKGWEAPVTFHCPGPIHPPHDVGFDTSKDVDTLQNNSELSDEGSCSLEPHTSVSRKGKEKAMGSTDE